MTEYIDIYTVLGTSLFGFDDSSVMVVTKSKPE
jgi:hypothetical protein